MRAKSFEPRAYVRHDPADASSDASVVVPQAKCTPCPRCGPMLLNAAPSPRRREKTPWQERRRGPGRASSASYSQCGRTGATVVMHGRGPPCFAWPRTDGEPSCVSEGDLS